MAFFLSVCRCGNFSLVTNPAGKTIEELEEHNRIVGGFVAPAHSVPYQVGLWYKSKIKIFA